MSPAQRAVLDSLPVVVRTAYIAWYRDRQQRKAAHRDVLEAFVAGYYAHQPRTRSHVRSG
jgi:hypothetical protein